MTGPDSLVSSAAKFCVTNLNTLLDPETKELKSGISLPKEICEKLLESADRDDNFPMLLNLIKDTNRTKLKKVDLCGSPVDDASFINIMKHRPITLDIHDCRRLTPKVLAVINEYGSQLESLTIGDTSFIFPESVNPDGDTRQTPNSKILYTPNVRKFVLWNHNSSDNDFWKFLLLDMLPKLYYLDLSGCVDFPIPLLVDGLNGQDLHYLSLYNVTLKPDHFEVLSKLRNLRHLDISQSSENAAVFKNPNKILEELVSSLPNLASLDISGTNLAGRGVAETNSLCDIPGLVSREKRPLEFLGLYGTHHDASHRVHLPARRISGDKDELQILTACQAYIDRHEVLEKVLNDLFHLFRGERAKETEKCLGLILKSMQRHTREKHVQISASASLFYIVKSEYMMTEKMKRSVLSALIQAMQLHKFDSTMMRNGCLTICHFKIPQDVMFQYEKLVRILLDILSYSPQEDFVERIAIYLLNSLACQVDGENKRLVGELGAIQRMLTLIKERLERGESDDVMDIAWSTLWNVTDETPQNCSLFLDNNGMDLFLKCLNKFPEKSELLRNMMGLLGNVAEVKELRKRLMNHEFINEFYQLLDSTKDNIEVSYNSSGILSHILSDGVLAWTIDNPTRTQVCNKIRANVKRWDLNAQRNINYRSFEPILRLVNSNTNECTLWAVWALANLTRVYPEKYCSLLETEKGLDLLSKLETTDPDVRLYIDIALKNCELFRTHGRIDMDLDG